MPRRLLRIEKALLDAAVLCGAYALAFVIRFEGVPPAPMLEILLLSLPVIVLVKCLCFVVFRVPKLPWSCVSLVEVRHLLLAHAVATAVMVGLRLAAGSCAETAPLLKWVQIPLGVLAIDFALSFLGTVGLRACYRLYVERQEQRRLEERRTRSVATLLVGTGRTGLLVARALATGPASGGRPVGFVDDRPENVGMVFQGIRVLATIAEIRNVLAAHAVEQVLITAADVPGPAIQQIMALCEGSGVPIKVVAEIAAEAGGKTHIAQVREVAIDDLLRREPVRLNSQAIAGIVRDHAVLVTGAGGSIGSELCRQVCRFDPASLILVEQAENNLFQVHRQLIEDFPWVDVHPCICDICDQVRLEQILAEFGPAVVFHAAAHKHVPMMEWNPCEAIKNNVVGTRTLADLAHAFGVREFVMISTDKAVNPSSVMGVSKRIAELYVQARSQQSSTRFVTVRFGNVLGSSGSVVPIFQEQIRKGGPVTVTHPEMTRFFMTIPEACQLVLEAAALGRGGEIFVLDMGKPIKIVDLASDMIRLSGFVPDRDIKISFTGPRPGEKLFEELSHTAESLEPTHHPRIFTGRLKPCDWETINSHIEELTELARCGAAPPLLAKIKEVVPEYDGARPSEAPRADSGHRLNLPHGGRRKRLRIPGPPS